VCQKLANIFRSLRNETHKIEWFESFLYIFKKIWNKIDNYRIYKDEFTNEEMQDDKNLPDDKDEPSDS
jgi:hypothetical protein